MPLIELDRSTARASFHRAPFAMRHALAGHDLFTLPRLVELAKSMPRDRIEYNSGKLEPGVRPEEVPGIAMPAEDVIRRIENADAWLVIKGVERDPAYRALLHEFLTEVSSAAGPATERFEDLQGFIFVSSAGSVTPFHFDAEENILVQVRGDKYVHIFDNADRSLVPEESLELSPAKHRNQPLSGRIRAARRGLLPIAGRCRAHSLSLAALGAHRLELVRVHGDDLEDPGGAPAQQAPPDQWHAAPLWPAAARARPVASRRQRQGRPARRCPPRHGAAAPLPRLCAAACAA